MSEVIPNVDLIRAVLDGKTVQARHLPDGTWNDFRGKPEQQIVSIITYRETWEYRVKPEVVTLYAAIIPSVDGPHLVGQSTAQKAVETAREIGGKLLSITLDPGTFEHVSTSVSSV